MIDQEQLKFLKEINIKRIALDKDRFGPLIFDSANDNLTKLKKFFLEIIELNYQDFLTEDEINQIDQRIKRLIDFINRLNSFDLKTDSNFANTHNNFENEVKNFYTDCVNNYRKSLVYLRQEVGLQNKDEKELQEQQKKAAQAEKQFNELSEKLTQQIEKLEKQKVEIETTKGEIATKYLAEHFAKQANDYTEHAEGKEIKKKGKIKKKGGWLKQRSVFYYILMGTIVLNFILYFTIFFLNKAGKTTLETTDIFTIEYGVVKLALVSLLYYGIYFSSKNYFIASNLASINKHRKNVAQTLEDFLATDPEDKETLSIMMKEGTKAMFKHLPSGYFSKEDKNDSSFINEISNKLPFNKE